MTEGDKRFMDLKMPKVDFERFSAGFVPEVSDRFLTDLGEAAEEVGKLGVPGDGNSSLVETPSRRGVGGGNSGDEQASCHSGRYSSTLGVDISPDRHSIDSLGLYDQDGFLIGSPDRGHAIGAIRSRGLRI
jgi:hypothetical protein